MDDFDFSHLNTGQNTDKQSSNNFDFSHLNSSTNPDLVNTFLSPIIGNLPKPGTVPEFNLGSSENKNLIDNLIDSASGVPGMSLVSKGIAGIGRTLGTAYKDISPLSAKAKQTEEEYENLSKEESDAQAQGQSAGLPKNVNVAQSKSFDAQSRIKQLQEDLGNQSVTLPKHVEEAKANIDSAQSSHELAKDLVNETENQLGTHLKKGIDYDVEAAQKIKNIEQANRQGIGKGYDELEKDWANRNVPIDNAKKIQSKNDELMDLIKSGGARSPEANEILEELDNLKNEKSINAKDYLRAYRSVSQYAREARQKAFQPGMNAEDRAQWEQTYNNLDNKVDEMGKTLENSVGQDEFQKLKKLNDRWRNEVVPLHKNRIFQNLSYNGTISDNIIKSLRGTNSGNVIIRNIIKNDPELLQTVVGQRYSIKPSEILNPTNRIKEYTDLMPEMNQLRDQHLAAKEAFSNSKEALDNAINAHKEITSNAEKYAVKRQQIEENQRNLELLDRHIENLRQIASKKGLSLEEKIKAQKEYTKAKKAKQQALGKVKLGFLIGASAGGLGSSAYYIGKLINNNQYPQAHTEGE
jgi:chromosome segregation ATPase